MVEVAQLNHVTRAVLAQRDVDAKTNEITRFRPLLAGLDLAGVVVTADALSRDPYNASYAEVVVMPRWWAVVLLFGGDRAGEVGIITDFRGRR